MIALAVWCVLAALASDALASTCASPSPEENFREANSIFVGVPLERRVHGDRTNWSVEIRFSVLGVLKGEIAASEIVLPYWGSAPPVQPLGVDGRAIYFTVLSPLGEIGVSACLTFVGGNNAAALQVIFAEYRAGLAEVDRQARDHPDEIAHRLARAAFLEQWGEADRAIRAFADISARWPSDARGWYGQGRLLLLRQRERWVYSTGPIDAAVAPLTRALQLNPESAETRALLAEAQLRAGDARGLDGLDLRGLQLRSVDLSGQVLAGRDLSGIYWGDINLSGADLSGSTLEHVHFNRVDLARARFRAARAPEASFYDSDLTDVDFSDADLSNTYFLRSTLVRADFSHARAPGARFDGSVERSRFVGTDLREAEFRGEQVVEVQFAGANLAGARFDSANISAVDFADATLDGASFQAAQLRGVRLSNASVAHVDWLLAQYDCQTRFPDGFDPLQADMVPIDRSCMPHGARLNFDRRTFPSANLQNADLHDVSFRRARFGFTLLFDANLIGADMSESSTDQVSFAGANLTNANFTNARTLGTFHGDPAHNHPPRLDGAIFRGAVFEVSNFFQGNDYSPADLTGTHLEGAILLCLSVLEAPPGEWRDLQIAWIRALEPRRRGVILGDGCDRMPELRDLR